MIGFSEDSKDVTVDEDNSPTFTLKLARTEAFFGEVEVSVLQLLLTNRATVQVDYGLHSNHLMKHDLPGEMDLLKNMKMGYHYTHN